MVCQLRSVSISKGDGLIFSLPISLHKMNPTESVKRVSNSCSKTYGNLRKDDGPADEDSVGNKVWYKNGSCHREDGPAVIQSDGHTEWWVEGRLVQPNDILSRFVTIRQYNITLHHQLVALREENEALKGVIARAGYCL